MKKATTKRERKYGKRNEDGVVEKAPSKKETFTKGNSKEVKVMVDYAMIIKFKTKDEANEYIDKKKKEAVEKNRRPSSYVII